MLFLLLLMIAPGCTTKPTSEAKDIIPSDSLVMILSDIQLIESALYIKQNEGKDIRSYSDHYYRYLYAKYHTDAQKIQNSLRYYQENPEKLESIYKTVLDSLSRKQSEAGSKGRATVNRPH